MARTLGPGDLWYLSPLAGGLAPAAFALFRLGNIALNVGGIFAVWAMRDLLVGYIVVLPLLSLCRRLRIEGWLSLWLIAALVGAPMGYVLAHPLEYAWTPTDQDFTGGPNWGFGLTYMTLFGLTGLVYAWTRSPIGVVKNVRAISDA